MSFIQSWTFGNVGDGTGRTWEGVATTWYDGGTVANVVAADTVAEGPGGPARRSGCKGKGAHRAAGPAGARDRWLELRDDGARAGPRPGIRRRDVTAVRKKFSQTRCRDWSSWGLFEALKRGKGPWKCRWERDQVSRDIDSCRVQRGRWWGRRQVACVSQEILIGLRRRQGRLLNPFQCRRTCQDSWQIKQVTGLVLNDGTRRQVKSADWNNCWRLCNVDCEGRASLGCCWLSWEGMSPSSYTASCSML